MTKSGRARWPGQKIPRIKAGSAHVPIYEGSVRGATRFTIAFYREGRRVRRTFPTMDAAIVEARTAAIKIQNGMAQAADLSVSDRETLRAAQSLLTHVRVPLLSAVEVLRHSFISYRLPLVKSAEQVALEAGNSPSII